KTNIITSYLLGADGARSKVRQNLKIEMKGDSYPEDWLILDTLNDPDTEPVSKFYCSSNKPYVSVPAPNRGRRYEFRANTGEKKSDLLDSENILKRLKPIRKIHKKDILRAAVYTFEAKIAEKWQDNRVFLLGDAAHVTPPFAGQGMNAGLRDAHNLSWKITLAIKGQCGKKLLSTYEEERRGPAWAMIQLAVAMGDIIMPQGESDIAFRTSLLQWMKRFPAAREFITSMKFKPPPRYERGAFVNLNSQTFSGSLVGQMLPQLPVSYLNGSIVRLDDIIGPNFSIIVQDESLIGFVNEIKNKLWPELALQTIAIGYNLVDKSDGVVRLNPIEDPTLTKIRSHRDQVLFVRPDRYVAASFDKSNLQDTIQTFQEFLL
ncbi:MAG: FAD-dependent monooxygenase, partial [Alphaproteobacteria bacterium]|nr:FAD-dependent monooxygenase [Alphaproteobacteria bacterium]